MAVEVNQAEANEEEVCRFCKNVPNFDYTEIEQPNESQHRFRFNLSSALFKQGYTVKIPLTYEITYMEDGRRKLTTERRLLQAGSDIENVEVSLTPVANINEAKPQRIRDINPEALPEKVTTKIVFIEKTKPTPTLYIVGVVLISVLIIAVVANLAYRYYQQDIVKISLTVPENLQPESLHYTIPRAGPTPTSSKSETCVAEEVSTPGWDHSALAPYMEEISTPGWDRSALE